MMLRVFALTLTTALAMAQNCTLCPDGGQPKNRTLAVPFTDLTCGHLEKMALRAANATACETLRTNAAWCQCPGVEPKCTLCPGGSSPPDDNVFVEEMKNATCGQLEYLATVRDQACDRITPFATPCGCPDAYACTSICPDGSLVSMGQNDTIVGETTSGETMTCGDMQANVVDGVKEQARCSMYSQIGVFKCGCNGTSLPEPACKLCENGQVPNHTNFLYEVDGKGGTCAKFLSELSTVDDPDSCLAFQATAGVYCGCENPMASASACRICGGDKLLPNPERVADTETGVACSEAEYVANLKSREFCIKLQNTFEDICCGPEKIDPNDTDRLPYADDIFLGATAPPVVRPTIDEPDDFMDSSVKGMCIRTISVANVMLVAALLF